MSRTPTAADWKLFCGFEKPTLDELTGHINRESMAILDGGGQTEHEKYLILYRHIHDSNYFAADCFSG